MSTLLTRATEWDSDSGGIRSDSSILWRITRNLWIECELWPVRRSFLQQHTVPQLVCDDIFNLSLIPDLKFKVAKLLCVFPLRTLLMGVGSPPVESFSPLVITIMAAGLGAPLVLLLLGGIFVCVRKKMAPSTSAYEPIN